MGIVFAVRGDSLDARYSLREKVGAPFNTVTVEADAGAIGGSRINMWQGAIANRGLTFPGRTNLPSVRTWSILMRCAFGITGAPASNIGIFCIGGQITTAPPAHMSSYLATDGTLRAYVLTEGAALGVNNASAGAFSPVAGTYYDIVYTFTGDTTVNGFKPYIDAVAKTATTSAQAWSASFDNQKFALIALGWANNVKATGIHVNEFVIWDEIINPSSVTLTSGVGALDGAARVAFVDVAAYEGGAATSSGGKAISLTNRGGAVIRL